MSKQENFLTAYIFNRNKTISEYVVVATKKFVVNDETYVIKDSCTYKKIIGDVLKLVAFYSEGNPNPYNLKSVKDNTGLTENELDDIIAGDIYNILIECQNESKQKYVYSISVLVLLMALFYLVMSFF